MGQIWNRISKLAKTYLQDSDDISTAERIIQSDADELRRIIDELSEPKKQAPPPPFPAQWDPKLGIHVT